jgi:hypothetical protein
METRAEVDAFTHHARAQLICSALTGMLLGYDGHIPLGAPDIGRT